MKQPNNIDFENDIIDITYNILLNTNVITEAAKKIIPYLSECIEKSEYFNNQLYNLIKLYISIDSEKINRTGTGLFTNIRYQHYVNKLLINNS